MANGEWSTYYSVQDFDGNPIEEARVTGATYDEVNDQLRKIFAAKVNGKKLRMQHGEAFGPNGARRMTVVQ